MTPLAAVRWATLNRAGGTKSDCALALKQLLLREQLDRHRDMHRDRETDRDLQAGRQRDRQRERQRDRETGRQTD